VVPPRSTVTVTRGKNASTVTISKSGTVLETQAGAVNYGGQVITSTMGVVQ
jgi:pilus assembly protein CpaB